MEIKKENVMTEENTEDSFVNRLHVSGMNYMVDIASSSLKMTDLVFHARDMLRFMKDLEEQ